MSISIAVLGGGRSPEYGVSLISAAEVCKGYLDRGNRVLPVWIDRNGEAHLCEEMQGGARLEAPDLERRGRAVRPFPVSEAFRALKARGVDLVFPALHGPFGEDGFIQTLLEAAGLRYVGSGSCASALGMSKRRSRLLFRGAGLPVAPGLEPRPAFCREARASDLLAALERAGIGFPLFLKTDRSGSSLGVARIEEPDALEEALLQARRDPEGWVVEAEIRGLELTCAVLGHAEGPLEALPVVEIRPRGRRFFDFEAKYDSGKVEELCPAPSIDAATERAVRGLAIRAHEVLGCRGFSRSDFILGPEGPVLLETNTIPGLTPESLLPKAARAAGLEFEMLLERLAREELDRPHAEQGAGAARVSEKTGGGSAHAG